MLRHREEVPSLLKTQDVFKKVTGGIPCTWLGCR